MDSEKIKIIAFVFIGAVLLVIANAILPNLSDLKKVLK